MMLTVNQKKQVDACERAREAGKQAFKKGEPVTANPYKKRTVARTGIVRGRFSLWPYWNDGWAQAFNTAVLLHTGNVAVLLQVGLFLAACSQSVPTSVEGVNSLVNNTMFYRADDAKGKWDSSCAEYGDCEDYALCKARKLIKAGYSKERLSLLVANNNTSDHAVLVVDNKQVLDNLSYSVQDYGKYIENNKPYYRCDLSGNYEIFIRNSKDTGYETVKGKLASLPKCEQIVRSF